MYLSLTKNHNKKFILCALILTTVILSVSFASSGSLAAWAQLVPQDVQTPVLQANDDSAETDEDHPVTTDVLANDSILGPGETRVDSVTTPSHGTAAINPDNTITYTPDQDFFGNDSFEYTVTYEVSGTVLQSDTAVVHVTVNPVNDPPVANDDSAVTEEDNIVRIEVMANDTDVEDDPLRITSVTQPDNGIIRPLRDGTMAYSPDDDFFGTDSFVYTISDGNGGTDSATVSVTINPVEDPPVARDDTAKATINQDVTADVLANDSDADGDSLSITTVSSPSNGTATLNQDETITYSPEQDFTGNDSFTYTISDGNGGADSAQITITVGRALTTISTCCGPSGVNINVNTNMIYVKEASVVSVIDGTTDTITKEIDSGFRAGGQISVNNATNMVYATVDRGIQVINGSDNTQIDSVRAADQTFVTSVDVNPTTNLVYVALKCLPCESHKVIDGNTNEIVDMIPSVGSVDVAVNPITNMIYFSEGDTVAVVDGSTNTIVERIQGVPSGPIGINPLTNTIYVADLGDSVNPVPTSVTVIDGNTNSIVTQVLVGNLPRGIAVNEVTDIVYVTNNVDDTVSIIDGQTNQIIDTMHVGDSPHGIAVNPQTNKVYVANFGDNTVTILQGVE